jgi:hypothetical protein
MLILKFLAYFPAKMKEVYQTANMPVCPYVVSNNFKTDWYIFMKLSMQVMKLKATSFYLSMPSAERENPVWDVRSEI